jgi:hypothetical protein
MAYYHSLLVFALKKSIGHDLRQGLPSFLVPHIAELMQSNFIPCRCKLTDSGNILVQLNLIVFLITGNKSNGSVSITKYQIMRDHSEGRHYFDKITTVREMENPLMVRGADTVKVLTMGFKEEPDIINFTVQSTQSGRFSSGNKGPWVINVPGLTQPNISINPPTRTIGMNFINFGE